MEEVEILPRDSYLHTVNIAQAPCTIQWWFSTKRKNIDFGLFRRGAAQGGDDVPLAAGRPGSDVVLGSRGSTIGAAAGRGVSSPPTSLAPSGPAATEAKQRGGYFKLQDRGVTELMPLKHYESSKTTIKGSWVAQDPGAYVLYFDNSFSKNTSKRLSFCVAVKGARQNGSGSSGRPTGGGGDGQAAVAVSGWLLKKKRKRMQGWASRWISIQGQWLLYSTTESGVPRAKVSIATAVVSTSRADFSITVDGDEGFLQLRAQSARDFDVWVAALKQAKELYAAAAAAADGATISAGSAPAAPSPAFEPRRIDSDDAARVQQAHAAFELAAERLGALLRGLTAAAGPDDGFRAGALECLQQIRDSEAVLHGALCADAAAAPAWPGLARKGTAGSDRRSLMTTDTRSSRLSGSASDVFYDTNEVLELARSGSGSISSANAAAAGAVGGVAASPDGVGYSDDDDDDDNEDDDDDEEDHGSLGSAAAVPKMDRMRLDLIRDPDFMEAVAQHNLQSPRADQGAERRGGAHEEDDDGGLDAEQRPMATVERVQAQLGRYEPRTSLPAPAVKADFSLISILRNNIGKDLTSIAMPLAMNEPINALQAQCEELRYARLLQTADGLEDSVDRLMYVAAYAVSVLSLNKNRAERKPFNPLLGETYELVDTHNGFRFVAEKVSHHPPVMACHAESRWFRLWQDSTGRSKFWGKSIELVQTSSVHIELLAHGDHFAYTKPTVLVRGLISGSRTVEYAGEMAIANRATGDRCTVHFKEATLFSAADDTVECRLYRGARARSPERVLRGAWTSQLLYDRAPGRAEALWTATALPPDADRYYGFSYFTMRLNELPPALAPDLPPTDTRFRPDQRAYERGQVDVAQAIKTQLEDAQRARNAERAAAGAAWAPQWFEQTADPDSAGGRAWTYKGGYWAARARRAFPPPPADLWSFIQPQNPELFAPEGQKQP
ncbi:Oxysterol-binding protein 3 [Coemansia javaensis]|uniref:Oxysterol-binding protein 3 n=1 Tax=Coemansia javaensis TaxID=2761396 RepID=A0A9W8HFE5_9FUNG|nr:Oxysterol-binding protein 3 [Coemansia javaensis]